MPYGIKEAHDLCLHGDLGAGDRGEKTEEEGPRSAYPIHVNVDKTAALP